ncbi:MAG: DUF6427 family protein [Prevotellaceae bacterium]|jgi:hypothetical protein|nr:DUF6427 family protein [Prevotellaceae bacterium]
MIFDFFQPRGIKRFVFILFGITVLFWQKIILFGEISSPPPIISIDALLNSLTSVSIYLSAIIKILLLILCSYSFIVMLSAHDVLPGKKHLAVVLFLAIISVFADAQNIANIALAFTFQSFAFFNVFSTYHSEKIKSYAFIAAFLAGISVMFYFPFIVVIISLIIGLWIFSVATTRNIISVIFGFFAPFVFLFYFYQFVYHDVNLILSVIENNFKNLISISFNFDDFNNITTIFMAFVFLVSFVAIPKIRNVKYAKNVHKKNDQMFYFLFFTSVPSIVLISSMKLYGIIIFGMSAAYLITRFSQLVKRERIAEVIVIVILIAAIAYNNYAIFV